eukprot:5984796-Pyramimonas_sp.AAC.1
MSSAEAETCLGKAAARASMQWSSGSRARANKTPESGRPCLTPLRAWEETSWEALNLSLIHI